MSWFSNIFEKYGGKILDIGASLYESSVKDSANEEAIRAANIATQQGVAQQQQGLDDAIAALERSKLAEQQLQQEAAPGVYQMRQAIAEQNVLTPAQQQQIEDARMQTQEAMAASGLRGSGRATSAAVRDVEGRLKSSLMDSNRARADAAASQLSSQYFGGGSRAAGYEAQKASPFQARGTVQARGTEDIGANIAAGRIAEGERRSGTASDIVRTIRSGARALDDIKSTTKDSEDKKRKSAYGSVY